MLVTNGVGKQKVGGELGANLSFGLSDCRRVPRRARKGYARRLCWDGTINCEKMKLCFYILGFCISIASTNAQTISTFAGGGSVVGDGGSATAAILNVPNGGVFDKHGNFYICEGLGQRVRKVSLTGIISRVAGTGSSGASGDGGAATSAQLNTPTDVALDTFGNIYISALNNFKVRKVNAITGVINTVVGTGTAGYNGDGILATTAQIQGNEQIWVDVAGNIFICDRDNFRVRKVNTSGIISTVAGGNFSGTGTGDGGLATAATFNMITGVAVDKNGNIFIADYNAAKVRKVDSAGIISTIAGNGTPSYIGDNIPATAAQIAPLRLTFDTSMNLVIADKYNHRIFKIDNFGIIHCIAGNGASGFTADGALATAASLDFPAGISYDPCGNLYIAEAINKRVRKVLFNPTCSIASLNTEIASIQENISIFPNPVGDELQIQNVQTKTEYKLCNAVGALLQSGFLKQDNNTISLKYLPLGMYMLVLTDEEGRKTIKKIVKD